jgi:protein-S-isoprenylcysteine O-methyltransferase Ste14
MSDTTARAHAFAWVYLCAHLAAHVIEEAATGFLGVANAVLAGWSRDFGLPLQPLAFGAWLGTLTVVMAVLVALTPRVARGAAWAPTASYIFAGVMIANGMGHLLSPLYLGRFLPGHFSSPLLIAAALWLIVQARRAARATTSPGRPRDRRTRAIVETAVFFAAAPGSVALWVPYALTGWELPFGRGLDAGGPVLSVGHVPALLAGAVLIAGGTAALVECFARFALVGRGTPSPASPTASLVVSGLYRNTRNPMYVAVASLLLGQTLLFGSVALLQYTAIVWLMAHTFVLAYEEPTLHRQFGAAYDEYRAHVPRWIPRLRPWTRPLAGAA